MFLSATVYENRQENGEEKKVKNIRLAYSPLINAGDVLNKELVEKISGKRVIRSKVYNADMMAIGGALFGAQYSDNKLKFAQKILHIIYGKKPLYVWGSGFLRSNNDNGFYRSNLKICALRGKKTQKKLEDITGRKYNVLLADAGLLVDMLLTKPVKKKYEIGLIPHFSQQGEKLFKDAQKNPDYHFIDIRKSPKEVAAEIASCKCIASSSLHGLIFADSMHIPSLRLVGKTELPGGEFKFEDYYSCYGVKDKPWRDHEKLPTKKDIIERSCVDFKMVDEKKKALIECFPKF